MSFTEDMLKSFKDALEQAAKKPPAAWEKYLVGTFTVDQPIPPSNVSGTTDMMIGPLAALCNSLRYMLAQNTPDQRDEVQKAMHAELEALRLVHGDKPYWPAKAVEEAMGARLTL